MSSSFKSNFQRSQSKVWWANVPERDHYGFLSLTGAVSSKSNKSRNSLTPPEIATTSWSYRRGSPGSLKSHDSGFSDSDHSPPMTSSSSSSNPSTATSSPTLFDEEYPAKNYATNQTDKLTPKNTVNHEINSIINQRSPSTSSERSTPPTVIRKKLNTDTQPNICRRISFSAPSSPVYERIESPSLINQIDDLNYATTSPAISNSSLNQPPTHRSQDPLINCKCVPKDRSIKRGKTITRSSKTNRNLLRCVSQLSVGSTNDFYSLAAIPTPADTSGLHGDTSQTRLSEEPSIMLQKAIPQTPKSILKSPKPYHNETVVFGSGEDSNNNSVTASKDAVEQMKQILPTYAELFPTITSTPKEKSQCAIQRSTRLSPQEFKTYDSLIDALDLTATMNWETCTYIEYTNPLLNGHSSSVQFWLDEMRTTYCHEVLSTLQTKSVAQQAARSSELNSATAGKIVRQLQSKSLMLQYEIEQLEKLLEDYDEDDDSIKKIPATVNRLHGNILEFVQKLGFKQLFHQDKDPDNLTFKNNVASIIDMSYDLERAVSSRITDLEPSVLLDDIQLLKRYLLITIRMVFEKLIRIIIDRIEDVKCDLILRSNLSMVSMLSNMEYSGFATLNDAFIATESVKVLLVICVESKLSSVRTLALRALATICSSKSAIRQFELAGGTEILKEIITEEQGDIKRSDPELREALSAFTQVTAPWHGKDHSLDGLRGFIESLVERITYLAVRTTCCQSLLLAVASLNNLSRMEITSIYSLMSNETVLKLKGACEARGPGASIFLYEQLVCMLLNMANNKRCHNHLANKAIIHFIISIFETQFHVKYSTRPENDALYRTIKNILYIFTRLIHESIVGKDILEQNVVPIFSRIEEQLQRAKAAAKQDDRGKDITKMVKQLNDTMSHYHLNHRQTHSEKQKCSLSPVAARSSSGGHGSITSIRRINGKKVLESYV